ncbi:MAG: hypothetical protein K2X48_02070 [Chitinophagaceae bacterium]|nr:hypothetical protein [Chitinophagaceae bacterium]
MLLPKGIISSKMMEGRMLNDWLLFVFVCASDVLAIQKKPNTKAILILKKREGIASPDFVVFFGFIIYTQEVFKVGTIDFM